MSSNNKYNGLLDVEMKVTVDINTIKMSVEDISNFKIDNIIDFKIASGSPAIISVNNCVIGNGDIIVIDDNLAIRINDIVDSNKILENDFFD